MEKNYGESLNPTPPEGLHLERGPLGRDRLYVKMDRGLFQQCGDFVDELVEQTSYGTINEQRELIAIILEKQLNDSSIMAMGDEVIASNNSVFMTKHPDVGSGLWHLEEGERVHGQAATIAVDIITHQDYINRLITKTPAFQESYGFGAFLVLKNVSFERDGRLSHPSHDVEVSLSINLEGQNILKRIDNKT